jgi:hypothetical protein
MRFRPILLAGVLSLAGCGLAPGLGGLGPANPGSDVLDAAAADLPGIDADIAKHTLKRTPIGTWVSQLPEVRREKMATLLSYRAMDNDLGALALAPHLNNLEAAGSSAYANLLVFADGPEQGDSRIYYMRQERTQALISPYFFPGGKQTELNSADPENLRQFVNFGYSKYQGRFRVLDVASHGGGYQGICADYAANYEQMSLDGFGTAVKQGLKGRKIDVLNLLACLMGAIEVAYEFRDVASVLVASEDNMMGDDVDLVMTYDTTFGKIASMPTHSPASAQDLGKALVDHARPERARSGAFTLAAIDMERIAGVKRQMNVLSNALLAAFPRHRKAILEAWNGTPFMYRDSQGVSSHRDIIAFCKRLRAEVNDAGVQAAALELSQAVKGLIISYRYKGPERDLAHGLSMYMPAPDEQFNQSYLKTRFARDTSWPRVIQAIQQGN